MREDCYCNVSDWDLSYWSYICSRGSYYAREKSDEMRSDSSPPFSSPWTWIHSCKYSQYHIHSRSKLLNRSYFPWYKRKNNSLYFYRNHHSLYDKDSLNREEKIKNPAGAGFFIFIFYHNDHSLDANRLPSRNFLHTSLEHFGNQYSMHAPRHHK